MNTPILDKFTNMPGLTRQARWKLRNMAKGRCVDCGRKCKGVRCKKHIKLHAALKRRSYHRNKMLAAVHSLPLGQIADC